MKSKICKAKFWTQKDKLRGHDLKTLKLHNKLCTFKTELDHKSGNNLQCITCE